jgi:hypothetical protein
MGLDMYLNAKRYLWTFPEDGEDAVAAKAIAQLLGLSGKRVKQVEAEAMYWRKANAIHKWFVDNVQEGTDDCGNYAVSKEQLEELRELILEAIETKNSSLLPPTSGFFFGSDKVDDYYWDDLSTTASGIAKMLEDFPSEQWEYEYHSSW